MDEKKTPPTQDALEALKLSYEERMKQIVTDAIVGRGLSDECQCDRTPRCPCCGKKLPFGTSWQYNYGPGL